MNNLIPVPRVLLAEPDAALRAHLSHVVSECAEIDLHRDFLSARILLLAKPFEWVITNVRLGAYNGLHLLHLARSAGLPARFLVYADGLDLALALAAKRAGAFYESREYVHRAVAAYLRGTLPLHDRRDPAVIERRAIFRGSRRCRDLAAE
jgi:DNA-binding NtrC family response regulator